MCLKTTPGPANVTLAPVAAVPQPAMDRAGAPGRGRAAPWSSALSAGPAVGSAFPPGGCKGVWEEVLGSGSCGASAWSCRQHMGTWDSGGCMASVQMELSYFSFRYWEGVLSTPMKVLSVFLLALLLLLVLGRYGVCLVPRPLWH